MQKGNNNMQHNHSDKDVIIRDHDGTFKILVDGKFVPLSEAESAAHAAEHAKKKTAQPSVEKNKPAPIAPKQKGGFNDDALTQKAKAAIKTSGVTFASQELEARAVKALIPQIKGVRKSVDTKQTLTKSVQDGGVGMEMQDVDRIMTALGGNKPEERQPIIDVSLTKAPKAPLKKVAGEVAHDVKPPQKIQAVAPETPQPKPDQSAAEKQQPVHAPKPALRDIQKQVPSAAIGPVQELSYKLIDWRRLGENPVDRVKKIESKLDVLEQDSYADRLAGIQAWHESEVVQLYETVGLKSLEQNLTVEQLLGQGGPDKLSFEEWRAIADLDERIRA